MKLIQTLKSGTKEAVDKLISLNSHLIKLNPADGPLDDASDLFVFHLAVQVAPVDTVRYIYNKYKGAPAFAINSAEPTKGDTPLHVAARYGRSDVVMYLMSLDELDESCTNAAGKEPMEVARTPELAEAMQVVRSQYVDYAASHMKTCFKTNNIAGLNELLSTPRAKGILDINGQDPETGSTFLHDFVKARNAPMVKFILEHGGDPFRRNSRGVLPIDVTKDEGIRRLLKEATKSQNFVVQTKPDGRPSETTEESPQLVGPPPSMKGFLKKWTNFTSGYKLRWFVLENGVLSYYKRQGDTENACRGSINMKQAKLHLGSSEKLQFEVISKGSAKFTLKANHPVETGRWVWALTNSIQYAKDHEKLKAVYAQQNKHRRYPSTTSVSSTWLAPSDVASSHLVRQPAKHNTGLSGAGSGDDESESQSIKASSVAKLVMLNNNEVSRGISLEDEEDDEEEDDSGEDRNEAPYTDEITSCEDSINIGLSTVESTIKSLLASHGQGDLSSDALQNGLKALEHAMSMINMLMKQFTEQIHEREEFYKHQIEKSEELQSMWTTTIREMEEEKDKIQGDLYRAILKRKRTNKVLREVAAVSRRESVDPIYVGQHQRELQGQQPKAEEPEVDMNVLTEKLKKEMVLESDEESDEEFFDALGMEPAKAEPEIIVTQHDVEETTETPVTTTATATTGTTSATETTLAGADNALSHEDVSKLTSFQKKKMEVLVDQNSFAGYEDGVRTRLAMSDDDRPKISLWGVLKNLIGKDMTRMTLPVSFNECTNLLMRSAEDMEYTDLLDKAASMTEDAGERMVYVAAYAASSYSSTINRIAKPFNPLLGETFEYSRPDKGYRMFSEQVSHHPPIGALVAESVRWDFYGASNVKSKFLGSRFDINPLGLWYITLRPNDGSGVEEELYSFRKVTSSVVGIITGSPTVDNYGDMEITNHTLGYKCILKFKARGWRGANAYEVKGTVVNKSGVPQWIVGGRWNDKIFAKKLQHQTAVAISNGAPESGDGSKGDDYGTGSSILVWQVHDRPKAPFNLTPFAITLNALPEALKNWVAPTDTRLRPDQRAMEEGRYDEAAEEKNRVEVKQREARHAREVRGEVYKPRWFKTQVHPVTQEKYWAYQGEYWPLRAQHELSDKGDIF